MQVLPRTRRRLGSKPRNISFVDLISVFWFQSFSVSEVSDEPAEKRAAVGPSEPFLELVAIDVEELREPSYGCAVVPNVDEFLTHVEFANDAVEASLELIADAFEGLSSAATEILSNLVPGLSSVWSAGGDQALQVGAHVADDGTDHLLAHLRAREVVEVDDLPDPLDV
jgi:hypothetical protein